MSEQQALNKAMMEAVEFVHAEGWDAGPTLFGLVPTSLLIDQLDPDLADAPLTLVVQDLPATILPGSEELAEYVAVAVREALLADPEPDAVVRYSELAPYDSEVLEVCLASLERRSRTSGRPHPAVPLLKGRLAVARR